MNKKDIKHVVPKVFQGDWRKLNKTNHVKRNRERANRLAQFKNDDYIILALKVIERDEWFLCMSNGGILILGENNVIVTVYTNKMRFSKGRIIIHWDLVQYD